MCVGDIYIYIYSIHDFFYIENKYFTPTQSKYICVKKLSLEDLNP